MAGLLAALQARDEADQVHVELLERQTGLLERQLDIARQLTALGDAERPKNLAHAKAMLDLAQGLAAYPPAPGGYPPGTVLGPDGQPVGAAPRFATVPSTGGGGGAQPPLPPGGGGGGGLLRHDATAPGPAPELVPIFNLDEEVVGYRPAFGALARPSTASGGGAVNPGAGGYNVGVHYAGSPSGYNADGTLRFGSASGASTANPNLDSRAPEDYRRKTAADTEPTQGDHMIAGLLRDVVKAIRARDKGAPGPAGWEGQW